MGQPAHRAQLMQMFGRMLLIRRFEERLEKLFAGGELSGTTHVCIGQEAVAVGVNAALEAGDIVVSNHRGHGHLLARGGEAGRLMAEIFGRRDGYSLGRGGSQHVAAADIGFLGANGITGGGIPVAAGQALALKRSPGNRRMVCCFFGDGAANQGTFAESLNMAALWGLPVLYVIENNGWAFSTRLEDGCAFPEPACRHLAGRAAPFGISHATVDGNDVAAVAAAAGDAADRVRAGGGPFLLECLTYRLAGHSKSDSCEYRTRQEEQEARERCPLARARGSLLAMGVASDELDGLEMRACETVEAAVEFARCSPVLPVAEAAARVYARPIVPAGVTDPTENEAGDAPELWGWQAIQLALAEELRRDGNVMMMGQDIAGYGGAFKVTRGMVREFGAGRVLNMPISENGATGLAIGAAMLGLRPVIEMMFADFALLAFDQLANGAAKFHYMYAGQVRVPLTVRLPSGGYRGYGPTHSQCVEAHFQGVPGLKIVAPSSPRQARALLKAAIRDDDPVLFVEHKLIYGMREKVPVAEELAPLGRARLVRSGGDVTVAAYGYMVTLALRAAESLAAEGIGVEVLDLRTIRPLDENALLESVGRTQHLVTLEEGPIAGGIGAEVAALVAEKAIGRLDGPVVRVGAADSPVPAARELEDAVLPGVARLTAAVRRTLGA